MNIADLIARRLRNHENLIGVSAPEVRAVVAEAFSEMERLSFPGGTTLDDVIGGEWESCEACEWMDLTENMKHDEEGVPLCPPCARGLEQEASEA